MKPQSPRLCGLAATAAALLAACGSPPGEDYFPTPVGARWDYVLRTEISNPPVEDALRLSVDRKVQLEGVDHLVRRSASGVEYFLRETDFGWVRSATRTDVEEEWQKDESPRQVFPRQPGLGVEWEAWTVPFVLTRNAEYPRELRYHKHRAIMRFRIEAMDQSVEVPAGKFSGCLRVKGIATIKLFTDPNLGFADQPLIQTEWYCKGVGLVRFDRDEPVNSTYTFGGLVSYQLTDYKL